MIKNRREFFTHSLLGAGLLASTNAGGRQMSMPMSTKEDRKGERNPIYAGESFLPVETPDIPDLAWKMDNGVKVFHLVAEPVKRQIHPNKTIDVWGYNGTSPGPTIQIMQEDRVRIIVDNHLPEATSVHWHGFELPTGMDGVPGLSQAPIPPGGRSVYEFTLHQEGTYFYHSHMAMQEMLGMLGAFIMHPKKPHQPRVDEDFVIMLQEYAVLPNNSVPNTMSMEFNWLVFNGKAGPAITPMIVRLGDRVRIRMINLGMDHHPVHLHGNTFYVTGTEGGRAPESAWRPENTVLLGVAQARDVEFDAKYPGDWMLHCHLPHHMMNQMASTVGAMTRVGKGMPAGLGMEAEVSPNANSVPGFPQDAYMEGLMMAMDKAVWKPENYGLPPGWSGFMQGMMTFVRVFRPDEYGKIMEMIRTHDRQPKPNMPGVSDMPGMNPRS
jgi:FtsP/CotA-like multicopper oxidase with cupredoxin domain